MDIVFLASQALSAALFLYYGIRCLFADGMAAEFERFGLLRFRRLTGSLEILGAVGLVIGQFIPSLVVVAAGGLVLLMALGVGVRLRLRDSLKETAPALVLMLVNLYIATYAVFSASAP